MLNGDVNEFVAHIPWGDELAFIYKGKKYFLQGLDTKLYLAIWEPPTDGYIWIGDGFTYEKGYPVDKFLAAPIFDGKTFWEVESEIEWVDS